jgi:hypothetical protein
MEGPCVRARAPARLLRVCECNRLSSQFMGDAYECLVPMIKYRCDDPRTVVVDRRSVVQEQRNGADRGACCPGG